MAGGGRRGWRARRDAPQWGIVSEPRARIVIIGGGPGGYEAALVAAQLGAAVTIVEESGLGGACVLTDCVPSKTLIATSSMMAELEGAQDLGIRFDSVAAPPAGSRPDPARADAVKIYSRIRDLAHAQSAAVAARLAAEGVDVMPGRGRLGRPGVVAVGDREIEADTVLIATGAKPRVLDDGLPDGERLLTCRQIYDIDELPSEL